MMVASRGARGRTSPLHNGQCSPQPAPDPVALTKAPHSTTATWTASTNHAYAANRCFIVPLLSMMTHHGRSFIFTAFTIICPECRTTHHEVMVCPYHAARSCMYT